jgi:hypothetical protein
LVLGACHECRERLFFLKKVLRKETGLIWSSFLGSSDKACTLLELATKYESIVEHDLVHKSAVWL